MPNYGVRASTHPTILPLGAIDGCLFAGIGGIYLAGLLHVAGQRPLMPLTDPRLEESLAFENS